MMNTYGLIGYPLSHSFSKKYFSEKFEKEGIRECEYLNFEIPSIEDITKVLSKHKGELRGFNITIPYKQAIFPYLDAIDTRAERIGAVNVVKLSGGKLKGYNSDYYGFKTDLEQFVKNFENKKALILGTGGASKAVKVALEDLDVPFLYVSRKAKEGIVSYEDITPEVLASHQIVINTTPLGMSPKVDACPDLPYEALTKEHFLYDLVYNPEKTLFMNKGLEKGSNVKNGLNMLHLQAEKAWEIWKNEDEN